MCLREKIGPDPRNFNQRVSLGRNDLLIRTFKGKLATALPLAQLLAQDAVEVVRRASSERNLSHQCATAVRRLT
jgi:hypothetical protein